MVEDLEVSDRLALWRWPDTRGEPVCPRCQDRKSTRLNSSHQISSYAVFCLKKKTKRVALTLSSRRAPSRRGQSAHPTAPPSRLTHASPAYAHSAAPPPSRRAPRSSTARS